MTSRQQNIHQTSRNQLDDHTPTIRPHDQPTHTLAKLLRQLTQLEIQQERWSQPNANLLKGTSTKIIQLPMATESFTQDLTAILESHLQSAVEVIRPRALNHISQSLEQVTTSISEFPFQPLSNPTKEISEFFERNWESAIKLLSSHVSKQPSRVAKDRIKSKAWKIWMDSHHPGGTQPLPLMDITFQEQTPSPSQSLQWEPSTNHPSDLNVHTPPPTALPTKSTHPLHMDSSLDTTASWIVLDDLVDPKQVPNLDGDLEKTPQPDHSRTSPHSSPQGTPSGGHQPTPLSLPPLPSLPQDILEEDTQDEVIDLTQATSPVQRIPGQKSQPTLTRSIFRITPKQPQQPRIAPRMVKGKQDPLSNFFPCKITFQNKEYPSAEHLYQALKADYLGHPEYSELIRKQPSAAGAKAKADHLFKKNSTYNEELRLHPRARMLQTRWDTEGRLEMVWLAIQEKANASPLFYEQLKNTGRAYIAHNVPDRFWGTGDNAPIIPHSMGENRFGILLMRLRQALFGIEVPEPVKTTNTSPDTSPSHTRKRDHSPPTRETANKVYKRHRGTTGTSTPPVSSHLSDPTRGGKKAWRPPSVHHATTIIGDSNLNRITSIDPTLNKSLAIHSYPGLRLEHLVAIVNQLQPIQGVRNIIVAAGINNREQQFQNTIRPTINKLTSSLKRAYPAATIYFAQIINDQLAPAHQNTLDRINSYFQQRGATLLSQPPNLQRQRDKIHWTEGSANILLHSWLTQLN